MIIVLQAYHIFHIVHFHFFDDRKLLLHKTLHYAVSYAGAR
ncbi:hypothetical protein PTE_00057 [Photorhabdus khanii NC19]|uniref:Uncharacterized protein n=1 Tax=Photorhabdus khanii NC19 TaxID=1004151 RepID=W3VAQ0_9GAMM|nr:hypothetical protein PTE_00057 [Photorhabdus khanii NC19]